MKHGAKVKLCSSEGCTNIAVKGGVCMKHVQRGNFAAVTDAQIKPYGEECVRSMGLRSNDATVKDVLMESSKEECG